MTISVWLLILIILALVFDFLNGFNDSGGIAATIISSRSLKARTALTITALAGFAGPFIFGVAVAKTIGMGIAAIHFFTIQILIAAVLSATVWSIITWVYGIPSSSSHALIGGLIGALVVSCGVKVLITKGIVVIIIALLFSPLAGLFFGWLVMKIIYRQLRNATPRANVFFKIGQIPTTIALAAANGANDSQKTIGLITLGLITTGYEQHFFVPLWVIVICAVAKSLGSFIGGWSVIRTVGTKFYKIKPIHSFTSQLSASLVIITSSIFGGPVSSTQVLSMSVIGAGAGERLSKVRWLTLKEIFISWILTIPFTAALAVVIYGLIKLFFH
ncbi:MAG: inorganic phosphate transporter [Chitinophagaceae bacterium]|nr:inorganic phosphate transporter [Chitinophagaceae bacterium]